MYNVIFEIIPQLDVAQHFRDLSLEQVGHRKEAQSMGGCISGFRP